MDFSYFEKGGITMYILAVLSVYGLAVVFYKIYQFAKAGVFRSDFIEPSMIAIRAAEYERVEPILARVSTPVSRIMLVALHCVRNRDMTQQSREAEVARVGLTELRYLEQHLRGLEMISTVGPLLGLLGTVMGMIRAFNKLEEAGSRVDPSVLAGGIWEALITTVAGLAVGIIGLAAYYAVDSVIERTRAAMKDLAVRILTMNDELQAQEIRKKIQDAEDAAEAKNNQPKESTVAQELGTLRLLNPRYGL